CEAAERMAGRRHGKTVLPKPDRRKHRLRERPLHDATRVELEPLREPCDARVDHRGICDEIGVVNRIPERRADLECRLADDTLRMDCGPPTLRVEQHVVVMKIAVQERAPACGRAEVRIQTPRSGHEIPRYLVVGRREIPIERRDPAINSRASWWRA